MKKSLLVAVLAVCVAATVAWMCGVGSRASAQSPGRQVAPSPIALIDINAIFKQHANFKAWMAQLKTEVDQAEAEFKTEAASIRKFSEDMQNYHPGTPEYKAAEERSVSRQTTLQAQMQLKKQEFLRKESAIYNGVYQEIKQEVDGFCTTNGIAIVLKFNRDPVNTEKPDDVLRAINSPVVWSAGQVDITQYIIDSLARRRGPANGNNGGQMGMRPAGVYAPPR